MDNPMITVPATTYVDAVEIDCQVVLTHVDEDLETTVVRFTAQNARLLAEKLVAAAEAIWALEERRSNGVGTALEEHP